MVQEAGDATQASGALTITPEQLAALLGGGSGSDKITYEDDPYGFIEQEFGGQQGSTSWIDAVGSTIFRELTTYAKNNGLDPNAVGGAYNAGAAEFFAYLQKYAAFGDEQNTLPGLASITGDFANTTTAGGISTLMELGRQYWRNRLGADFSGYTGDSGKVVGGGGGGRTYPTSAEIRQAYDLNQLAQAASDQWGAVLLDDAPDARAIAREYVDAMVASRGQQKLDFNTFVRGKIKGTARYASIYRNKPEGLTEENYIGSYLGAALSKVRPDNANALAIGGAMFGSSASTFEARLNRTSEVTGSAPFINDMQDRMGRLKGLFKG